MSYHDELRKAAQAKGSPLTNAEVHEISKREERNALRERFRKVIIGAGYKCFNGEKILAQYFDEYMKDIPSFVAMLENYEKHDYDPD